MFDTPGHAEESNRVASRWLHEERLETVLPKPAKITTREVVVHRARELVEA